MSKVFDLKGRGRMIFAALGGMIVLLLRAVFPQLPFTDESVVLFLGLIGAYIIGEGISGKIIGDNVVEVLKSQKFQALAIGLVVSVIKGFFPNLAISDVELTSLFAILAAFIVGAGVSNATTPTPEG